MSKAVVSEFHKGLSKSSNYIFVIEGDSLIHISRYAVSIEKNNDYAKYIVDLDSLRGKKVLEIMSSNSGIFCNAYVYSAEELTVDPLKRREERKPLSIINTYKLAHLTPRERAFLNGDWKEYYLPMLRHLRRTFLALKEHDIIIAMSSLMGCQILGGIDIPLSYLVPYSEYARRKSLEALTKEIHQMWTMLRIIEELARRERLVGLRLNFEQSSYFAPALFKCRTGLCSLWYEFDMNPYTMCSGIAWYGGVPEGFRPFYERATRVLRREKLERVPLRPDIVVLEGDSDNCEKLARGFRVKAIIECKNQDFMYWRKSIREQIIPYKEIFNPEIMVVASMRNVPQNVKEMLQSHGILVIDGVHPGGRGEEELARIINHML